MGEGVPSPLGWPQALSPKIDLHFVLVVGLVVGFGLAVLVWIDFGVVVLILMTGVDCDVAHRAIFPAHEVRNGAMGEVRRVATNKPPQLALFPARRQRALAVGGRGNWGMG